MRRPLKPFVTEYKATNRRPKDGAGLFGAEPEASMTEAPTRKPPRGFETASAKPAQPTRRGEAQRGNESPRYNGGPSEDSYEAAMRAADALFSGAPSNPAPANPAHASPTHASPSHATPKTHEVFGELDGATQSAVDPAPTGPGRILRVLDEEPDPALLAMEAERTPKRRGRKPGSKNKPKVAESHLAPALGATPERIYAFESRHDHSGVPTHRPPAAKIIFFPPVASRGGERFAWVRTKLRPGEAWKRRLPKVIW